MPGPRQLAAAQEEQARVRRSPDGGLDGSLVEPDLHGVVACRLLRRGAVQSIALEVDHVPTARVVVDEVDAAVDRHAVPVPGERQLEPALDVRRGQRGGDRRPREAVEHLPGLAGQRPRRRVVEGALALLLGEIGQRIVVEGIGRALGDLEGAVHEQATQRRQAVTVLVLPRGGLRRAERRDGRARAQWDRGRPREQRRDIVLLLGCVGALQCGGRPPPGDRL